MFNLYINSDKLSIFKKLIGREGMREENRNSDKSKMRKCKVKFIQGGKE